MLPTAQALFQGSPQGAKISVQEGPALSKLVTGVIRSVFIDADKQEYVQLPSVARPLLLAPHGFIC